LIFDSITFFIWYLRFFIVCPFLIYCNFNDNDQKNPIAANEKFLMIVQSDSSIVSRAGFDGRSPRSWSHRTGAVRSFRATQEEAAFPPQRSTGAQAHFKVRSHAARTKPAGAPI